MTQTSQDVPENEYRGMSLEQIEEIRVGLRQRQGGLEVNQQVLFKYTSALPPASRAGALIAGWGPFVFFALSPVLYFVEWKLALLSIFLSIFWVGMGRKYVQAAILRQCHVDGTFLKFALTVGLVKLR